MGSYSCLLLLIHATRDMHLESRPAVFELEEELPLYQYDVEGSHKAVARHGYRKFKEMTSDDRIFLEEFLTCMRSDKLSMTKSDSTGYSHYCNYFNYLLEAEEIQMEVDICKYDMHSVSMTYDKQPKKLVLKVPGLVESRPSILKGDHLFVKFIHDPSTEYQGYIHEVRLDEVVLGFSNRLLSKFVQGCLFDVRFTYNRLPLKYQHRAIELVDELSLTHYILPGEDTVETEASAVDLPQIRVYDTKLNSEQVLAVQHILAGTSKPYPYIIFGPPGTGKTVTVVEAIKQIALTPSQKSCHILACAPSNSAADLLCERLLTHLPARSILRLNASSRAWSAVPEQIKHVCNYDKHLSEWTYPKKLLLTQYKVIICTTVSAGRLVSAKFNLTHFTHIFIDEAGQAVEPECLIPIAGLVERGQVVLVGDPKQLGPILRSPTAIKYKLDQSFLERLMASAETQNLYGVTPAEGGLGPYKHNPKYFTKLIRNYRSHASILEYPNMEFYDNDLRVCADEIITSSLCGWDDLPTRQFPLIFHSVLGKDEREDRSPSFFNADECKIVLEYVEKLLEAKRGQRMKVLPSDIGIISPYRKQVQKISRLLERRRYKDIKVGSVEEFQGQERLVIIVSTVRSAEEYLHLDCKYHLGFLNNPKRLNVAITRSKALLIVVGNPYVLRRDFHWRRLLEYIEEGGGWRGVDCELSAHVEVDTLQGQLTTLNLIESKNGVTSTTKEMTISMKTLVEDPEWMSSHQI